MQKSHTAENSKMEYSASSLTPSLSANYSNSNTFAAENKRDELTLWVICFIGLAICGLLAITIIFVNSRA